MEQMNTYNSPQKKTIEETELHKKLEADLRKYNFSDPEVFPIQVCEPVVKGGVKSYVIYTIKIENTQENIFRRYSDFYVLREKLMERWPGIYIPNIPPKKTVGNLEMKLIESRVKLLNKFLLKIHRNSAIFNSDEMKIFLSNINDIKKGLSCLANQTYEDLYTKYKQAFPNYYEAYELTAGKTKINEFQNTLKKALANLRNFKDVVKSSMKKKQLEIDNYLCLISVFSDYEKYTLMDYVENDDSKLTFFNPKNTDVCMKMLQLKEGIDNPYNSMYEWLQEEEVDIDSMIEAISSLVMLYEMNEKQKIMIKTVGENLKSIQSKEKGFSSFFSFTSRNNEIQQLESNKKTLEKCAADLEGVIKLATYNMESNIEYFKLEKLAGYYQNLKRFAEMKNNNANKINNLWSSVATAEKLIK